MTNEERKIFFSDADEAKAWGETSSKTEALLEIVSDLLQVVAEDANAADQRDIISTCTNHMVEAIHKIGPTTKEADALIAQIVEEIQQSLRDIRANDDTGQ
ncbi:hypothetical protein ABID65_006731 [Bradyrhizobium sp. S3.9.2]|uniref:hypothetical protein n=1 Tax=Bradyrhizobium sp. S3.9.2 TaxID=3156432 RepID=UPI00339805B5